LKTFVSNYLARFVDRDMYMRYAGGGVGHYKVDLMEGSRDSAPPPEPEPAANSEDAFNTSDSTDTVTAGNHGDASFPTVDDAADNADGCDFAEEDPGEDSESDHEDLESEHEGSENYDQGGIEENFGAEDGEGMFGDVEDEEGYAPL
jgi:hypothetical protein